MDLNAVCVAKTETRAQEEPTLLVVTLNDSNTNIDVQLDGYYSNNCTNANKSKSNDVPSTSVSKIELSYGSAIKNDLAVAKREESDNVTLLHEAVCNDENDPEFASSSEEEDNIGTSNYTTYMRNITTAKSSQGPSIVIDHRILTNQNKSNNLSDVTTSKQVSLNLPNINQNLLPVNSLRERLQQPMCSSSVVAHGEKEPSLVLNSAVLSNQTELISDIGTQDLANLPVIIDGITTSNSNNDQNHDAHASMLRPDHVFAVPSTSRNFPDDPNNKENVPSYRATIEQNNNNLNGDSSVKIGTEWFKVKNINLYAEDTGPKFYKVSNKFVTPPLITKNLTEAFSFLPIFGRPSNKDSLVKFQINKIRDFVGGDISNQDFEILSDYCSPVHLKTGKELNTQSKIPGYGLFPSGNDLDDIEGPELNIHRKLRMRIEQDVKNNYLKKMKYRGIRIIPLDEEDDNIPKVIIGEPLQPGRDILYRIRIYRPFIYATSKQNGHMRRSVFSHDLLMLGRQKLSLLRDRIMCCNDLDMRVDMSERPDDMCTTGAKDMFPSGFLFINNVFYVDTRAGCADRSAVVRSWAAGQGLGAFPARDMAGVSLEDLVIKLGHPDVYVHQGDCEHVFLFSEVRLLNASDPLQMSAYPRHLTISQNHTIYCTTCAEFAAKWVVVGCDALPFDPSFFCEKCYKMYMYINGDKKGNFKAFMYKGNEIK